MKYVYELLEEQLELMKDEIRFSDKEELKELSSRKEQIGKVLRILRESERHQSKEATNNADSKALSIADVSNWVAVKDALPVIDTFYIVASSNLQNWTKALYRLGEFLTIEDVIDGNITHWRYIKPPCC